VALQAAMSIETRKFALVGLLTVAIAAGGKAQSTPPQEAVNGPAARVVVTVSGRNDRPAPALAQSNVLVFQGHQRRPVLSWVHAEGSTPALDLAILVDDSAGPAFDNQIRDLRQFVRSLPESTRVAVVYSTNGNANLLQRFTVDHNKAADALRLPLGRSNEVSSVYLALADLFKHWPADPGRRRAILLISDGVDLYRGVAESEPGNNPDLDEAVHAVLQHRVTVYTLFASAAGSAHRNLFLLNNGQSCESVLTSDTGGQSFFQGLQTPVSFSPYLHRLSDLLNSQYVLTFIALPIRKPGTEPLHVTTELPNVELVAPTEVWVH
jgi:hypothetical protein